MKTILYNTTDKKLGRRFTPQYLVDGKVGQLPNNIIELAIVEAEPPAATSEQRLEQVWIIDEEQREYRQQWAVIDLTKEELTPSLITKAQGLILLHRMGMYEEVMSSLETFGVEEQIIFEATKEWELNNRLVGVMQTALGLTDDEKFDFFVNASQIEI